ncbi:MAG TPA: hypothetical protein VFT22_26900 [Kofleriaceae bacterium]|nr:hypothetical protein [Kofleriaceae bacterium]
MTQRTAGIINAWEQDPGSNGAPDGGALLHRDLPKLEQLPFATKIMAAPVPPDGYQPGTAAFRYWACADALRRTADFWGGLLGGTRWHPDITDNVLPVQLDEGVDLNAYYDRQALHFFHAAIGGRMIYSGESPDVVCHEFGHAVLDAIRPQLWDVAAFEPPAFHESFGDMSAILTALQLPSVRIGVLQETSNEIYRSSRLSRLAEQLGWAIRQKWPDQVDSDCLRNAVNSFFYQSPEGLPTSAPAKQLSSEPHSFSRVFTAAFLETLGLMFAASGDSSEAALQAVSIDLGRILLGAIAHAPVVPEYFAQVGAHMIALATSMSSGYGDAVKMAMVKHGIVSVPGVTAVLTSEHAAPLDMHAAAAPALLTAEPIDVSAYGLTVPVVHAYTAAQPKRFAIAGAAPSVGDAASAIPAGSAMGFFEDLIRRGRLDFGAMARPRFAVMSPRATVKTHRLSHDGDRVMLRRIRIDCGLHKSPDGQLAAP